MSNQFIVSGGAASVSALVANPRNSQSFVSSASVLALLTKTSGLVGPALDWAVAKAAGISLESSFNTPYVWSSTLYDVVEYCPSTDWSLGGPIIEQEKIVVINPAFENFFATEYPYIAWAPGDTYAYGDTHLVAAMRCYVASKLGDEIEVPKELK